MDFDDRGCPILSLPEKLDALRMCLEDTDSAEDAIGHAVDLLEFALQNCMQKHKADRARVEALRDSYAAHPTAIRAATEPES